ncbi:hypothetical protein V8C35DRAFT_305195 [Trichoderma chlorosporum]
MGRPLFVAPVETDLPHKDAQKRDVLSPSRSAIRRSTHAETRDRRNPNRRAGVRIVSLQPHTRSTRRYPPWDADDGTRHLSRPSDEASLEFAREALRDVTYMPPGTNRPDRHLEDQMSTLFGGTWHNIGAPSSQRSDEAAPDGNFWWNLEPRQRRARIVAPDNPSRNRSPYRRRSYHIGTPPYRPTRDGSERLQSESATSNDDAVFVLPPYRPPQRDQNRAFYAAGTSASRLRQRAHAADGLRDRDRSLSPEVWDTLLSTLTPDPQPPSASSSFASGAVAQNAGPSSALPSAPGAPEDAGDGACESGHEFTEDEDELYAQLPPGMHRLDRQLRRQFRQRPPVPDYNLDGPSDGPLDEPQPRRPEASRPGQSPGDSRTNRYALLLTNSWLTHAGSEDERGTGRAQPNREGSAGSGPGAQTGDEDWLGMRRIVQSLAAREDIPDEWWAEAGLSRTLPHDESN